MNFFDLLFILLILWSLAEGWFKGPLFILGSLAGVLSAFYLSEHLVRQGKLSGLFGGGVQGSLLGYSAVSLGALVLGWGLSKLVAGISEKQRRRPVYKQLALIIGVARSQVFSLLFYGAVVLYVPSFGDDLSRSFFVDWLAWLHQLLGGAELALITP